MERYPFWYQHQWFVLSLVCFCWLTGDRVLAQVRADDTLPSSSIVDDSGNTIRITGGTTSGTNLFHSFREFSVPRGRIASFRQINGNIDNVFARVTGTSRSEINGAIEALQANDAVSNANIFFLNPNGIVFGPDASLNIGGSFVATTADQIQFADGTEFSAIAPEPTAMLTMSVPIGLQMGRTPGRIINRSVSLLTDFNTGNPLLDEEGNTVPGGLQVRPGRTFALVGGPVRFPSGGIVAEGGRVEIGAIAPSQQPPEIGLTPVNAGWSLDYSDVQQFDDIHLSEAAIDVSGARGGGVHIQGRQLTLTNGSIILGYTLEDQPGKAFRIRAEQLHLDRFAQIVTSTIGSGNGGNVFIDANQLTAQGGGGILAQTEGDGDSGSLTVRVTDRVILDGTNSALDRPTGLFAQSQSATGNGGRLRLSTRDLHILGGAEISTTTVGAGNAGSLQVTASTIQLDGVFRRSNGAVLVDREELPFPSGLFSDTDPGSAGNGGPMTVMADQIRLSNGAVIQTNTEGSGKAGDLTIRASDWIEVTGIAGNGLPPSTIFAASGGLPGELGGGTSSATGSGGTTEIVTPTLRLQDGGAIAVGSLNPDATGSVAGSLNIRAGTIALSNQGRLVAETASGNGGNITLQVQDFLVLQRNSQISTTAGTSRRGGDGGDITIIGPDLIVAAPAENSDISANAFTGRGGNIRISQTSGIFGIAPRDTPTSQSDITASSERGVSGTIQINTPDIDPSTGLVELPTSVVDSSTLIARGCSAQNPTVATNSGRFVVTGRGGLPPNPGTPRGRESVITNWVGLNTEEAQAASRSADLPDLTRSEQAIAEAQQWIVGTNGEIMLTAQSPAASSPSPASFVPSCNDS